MRHGIAQTAVDIIGDLLSKCRPSHCCHGVLLTLFASPLYPNQPHLEDPNPMDPEGPPRALPMPDGRDHLGHNHAHRRHQTRRRDRLRVGVLLPHRRRGGRHHLGLCFHLPNPLRLAP